MRVVAVDVGREVPVAARRELEVSDARRSGEEEEHEETTHMMLRRPSESRKSKLALCGWPERYTPALESENEDQGRGGGGRVSSRASARGAGDATHLEGSSRS